MMQANLEYLPGKNAPDVAVPSSPVRAANAKPHAVVIGSGFGGLAAAIRLQARGYRVTVYEALDQAGGRARVFKDKGFVFDAGPTVITAPFLFEELWQLAGRRLADDVDMRPVKPFYRIRFADGTWFHYTGDAEAMRAEVARLSPDDVAGYDKFIEVSCAIFKVGFEELAHKSFANVGDMLRIVPKMIRLQSFRSVFGLVQKHIKDERLRQVLSFHPLLVGGNPFDTTSIYTLILFLERRWGVHFPIGGTGALVQGMIKLIAEMGGEVVLNAPVERITVQAGVATGVALASGACVQADIVVSNADSAWTYKNLLGPEHRKHWTDKRLARQKYSMGLFVWYFGTSRKYEDVAHHSILLGPRYKALLDDIFNKKILAEDFSLYLHRPTATDPNLAPAGSDAFYVLSPVPHLDADVDWNLRQEAYRQKIAAFLEATILPGFSAHTVVSKVMTPQHFESELSSYKGAAFGIAPVLRQSAYFRPHNVSEDVGGLYFVGAGTHPGAGVPGVLSSARVLDEVVPAACAQTAAHRSAHVAP